MWTCVIYHDVNSNLDEFKLEKLSFTLTLGKLSKIRSMLYASTEVDYHEDLIVFQLPY